MEYQPTNSYKPYLFYSKFGLDSCLNFSQILVSEIIIAKKTSQLSYYLKRRGFDKDYYKKLVFEFIDKSKVGVNKQEIKDLLWNKLPEFFNDKQKINKISNILSELKRENKITNVGSDTKSCWKSTK